MVILKKKMNIDMEAKDLRIGNYYIDTIDDKICCVTDGHTIYAIDINMIVVKPIPLTEEWLLKLGFEKWTWCDNCAFIPLFFGDSLYCRYYNGQWHIKRMKVGRDKRGVFGKSEGKYLLRKGKIKHVHQLQNLYYALTGNELVYKKD